MPHWFAWENQYGGIAVAEIAGTRKLFVLMVDNPAGKNGGFYTTVDLDQDPKIYGKWEVLPFHSGVLAVHAALLPRRRCAVLRRLRQQPGARAFA